MSEFSTGWLREIIAERFVGGGEAFDRWMAKHDTEIAEEAVRGFVRKVSDSVEDYLSIVTLDALGAAYIRAVALDLKGEHDEV